MSVQASQSTNQSNQVILIAKELKGSDSGPDLNPRDVNYAMIVMEVMVKFGLAPIEKMMQDMAKLEKLLSKFQGDFTEIQQFLNMIEEEAHSGKGYWKPGADPFDGHHYTDPNAFNGLPKNFWKEHASDLKEFMNTIKSMFYAGSDKSNPTLGDLMKEFGGSSSDLMNYFKKISKEFNDPKDPNHQIITTDPNQHVSMIQLLVFLKLQLAVDEKQMSHSPIPSDLTKVFDPYNKDGSGDGMIKSLMGFLNSLTTDVSAKRKGGSSEDFGNLLDAIKDGNMDKLEQIFGAMAYNYYWTKNPNASDESDKTPMPPNPPGFPKGFNFWQWKDDPGEPGSDVLSILYGGAQSSSSLISSNSNEDSTSMQEYSSEVSQYQNIGQNITKSVAEGEQAFVNNEKTG